MAIKNIAVFGIYPDQLTAEDAVDNLKDTGFRSTDISVLFPDNQGTKDFAHEKHTKAPEAAVAGGSSGASHWRSFGMACRHRRARDSRSWGLHRSRSHHGDARWHRSWWSDRRHNRRIDRFGHSGVRSETLRRQDQARRNSAIRALR